MTDPKELPVYEALNALGIPYARFEHEAAMTMDDCEAFDESIKASHCKNLFLTNRQGTSFYLLLIAGEKPFKTKDISKQLGVARLSFGSAGALMAKLGLTPGAVTPMGLINDAESEVKVLLDKDVAAWDDVIVHPNVNTASIILKTGDLLKFIKHRRNELVYVDVEG